MPFFGNTSSWRNLDLVTKKAATATYRAVVAGDRIEWIDGSPGPGRLEVRVSLLSPSPGHARRRESAIAALERLASLGGIGGIDDPAGWQRQLRDERPLPGRSS